MGESASMTSGSSIDLTSPAIGDDEVAHNSLGRIFDTIPESGLAGMSTLTNKFDA
jgi:hypothetical protein